MDVEMDQTEQAAAAAPAETTPAPEAAPPAPPNPDLEAYNQKWQAVQADPQDFNTWTSLLTTAERLDDVEKIRAAYDAFLAEYPLCYGYWKKYADAEARHQNVDVAMHVYERGVAATPYSSDLWGHYAAFKKSQPDASADDVRNIYERALAYVATDYNAHPLWDKYLTFEQEKGSTLHVASLYSRVLGCPVRELDRYYTSFKNYVHPLAAAQIVRPDDYDTIRTQLEVQRAAERAKAAEAAKAAAEAKAAEEAKAKASAEAEAEVKEEPGDAAEAGDAAATAAEGDTGAAAPADGEGAAAAEARAEGDATMKEAAEGGDAGAAAAEGPGAEAAPAAEGAAAAAEEEQSKQEAAEAPPENADQPMADAADVKSEADGKPAVVPEETAPAADAAAGAVSVKPDPDAPSAADGGATAADTAVAAVKPSEPEPIVITDEEIKQVWVRQQDELYEQTKQELLRRKPYEDAARRPYFHIKPLDGVQLFNWIRYLDYVEAKGDHGATVTLYERCLVACANYPEYWQRYVRYLERTDPAAAKPALERAVQGFCKRRPEIYLFAAHFDERHGDVAGARARFKELLQSVAPRLLEAVTAAANFERRQGNLETACSYLSELMSEERSKDASRIYPFLAIHYAHFLRRHANDVAGARKVLDDALKQCPGVRSLWEAAVHFEELVGGPEAVARALDLYDKCTASPPEGFAAATAAGRCLPERDREELSARSVDFADMYGTAEQVQVVSERHSQRFMLPTTVTAEARAANTAKRVAEAAAGTPAAKAQRTDATAAAAAAATGTTAAAAAPPPPPPMMPAAAGYYPPAPPAAAAAAAAAAYGSYYGYGQYPAAPQYPGYGAYPGYGY